MANNSTTMIDGFASVQAVKRATQTGPRIKPKSTGAAQTRPKPATSTTPTKPQASTTKASRTAQPTRRIISCYECGYTHTATGVLHNSFCPKCRTQLNTGDETISGDWSGDCKTIGTISVAPKAKLKNGILIANKVELAADASNLQIKAAQLLILKTGAGFDKSKLEADHVQIDATAKITLPDDFSCKTLEILGTLEAHLTLCQQVIIHPGGLLKGSFEGHRLTVHEGGGLQASLNLTPPQKEGSK